MERNVLIVGSPARRSQKLEADTDEAAARRRTASRWRISAEGRRCGLALIVLARVP